MYNPASTDSSIEGMWGFLIQVSTWIHHNPLTFLTGLIVFITAITAFYTRRYVQIVANQFAAQIEPEITVAIKKGRWHGDDYLATLVITASRNTLVLKGGDILLRCEHGSIRLAIQLTEWIGHSLTPGQRLSIKVMAQFQHPVRMPHRRDASLEGSVEYADTRNNAAYHCDLFSDGVVTRHGLRQLGKIRLWLAMRLHRLAWRLTLWQIGQRIKEGARKSIEYGRGQDDG